MSGVLGAWDLVSGAWGLVSGVLGACGLGSGVHGHGSPRAKAARKAVMTLLVHSKATLAQSNSSWDTVPSIREATAARSPTTVACICQDRNQTHEKGP